MKRWWWLAVAFVALFAALGGVLRDAAGDPARYSPPPLRGYVVDETRTLSAEQIATIEGRLQSFRRERGFAIVALVLPTLSGMTIEDVAYETFNTWQIGDKDKDNGVLLVIAPAERRVRIETGKGVGGELTDLESAEILRSQVGPALAAGDLYRAVDRGTAAIQEALVGDLPAAGEEPPPQPEPGPVPLSPRSLLVIAIVVALAGLLAIVSPGFRMFLFALLWSAMRGGGGLGGGGGGGPGGGGRSGGGGASGSY